MHTEYPAGRERVRIVPVLDVMNGQVVRAVGGRRELYGPVRSRLTDSTEPRVMADVLLTAAKVNELYVADLDTIQGHRPRLGWVRGLIDRGNRVMVDCGIRIAADAKAVSEVGADVVVGTETLTGIAELKELTAVFGPARIILSVDLRNGRLIGNGPGLVGEDDPLAVVGLAVAAGVKRVLALELARVGTGVGPGTVAMCREIRTTYPDVELTTGGGVRAWDDVNRLAEAGADAVLVASALHNGAIAASR